MLAKDLRQYSKNSKPQLAIHYVNACKEVYKVAPYIHVKLFPKFRVFEDDLRELNISTREYAYVTMKTSRGFVTYKHWQHLPVNLFLSDYYLGKFVKLLESETVQISTNDKASVLFHDELLVARVYIDRDGKQKVSEIVEELQPLLSKTWLQVYSLKGARPIMEVLDQLIVEYVISTPVYTYKDIVVALQ